MACTLTHFNDQKSNLTERIGWDVCRRRHCSNTRPCSLPQVAQEQELLMLKLTDTSNNGGNYA
jgi:hypothetical protein